LTSGVVTGIKGTTGPHRICGIDDIFFSDAIVTVGMSSGGDSGSLLFDNAGNAIGLLYGGMLDASSGALHCAASWYNPIEPLLTTLGVNFGKGNEESQF
jgi:hypothetical protein